MQVKPLQLPPTVLPQRSARRAFTLVEMLVVITIIGVLAGLISVAVSAAARRARVMAISREIEGIQAALTAWKEKYSEFPPDFGGTDNSNGQRAMARRVVVAHLQTAFPRFYVNGDPNTTWDKSQRWALAWHMDNAGIDINALDPSTALAFWLGGMPLQDSQGRVLGQVAGFSPNPGNPFDTSAGSRLPPLFAFDSMRLKAVAAGGIPQTPPYTKRIAFRYCPDTPGTIAPPPYIYFAARQAYLPQSQPSLRVAGQQVKMTLRGYRPDLQIWPPTNQTGSQEEVEGRMLQVRVRPYFRMTLDGKVTDWFNPSSCQIICAGLDGQYGAIMTDGGQGDPQGFPVPRVPIQDNLLGQGHYDNVTNFGVIENIQP